VRNAGVRGLITFGANALGYFCINYFSRNLDKALVGWKSGAGALGLYSRAYYLFVVPINQFCIPLHGVAVTTLTKLRNDPERFQKFYMRALSGISFVGMPLSTFLASVGRELILLLLGPQWTAATGIFMIFGLSAGIQIIYSTKSWLHVALGRTDRWLRWGIIATVVTSVLFFAGLPFGATGVAIGYTFSLYILTIPAILYAGRPVQFRLRYLLSGIWRYYAAAAGAGCVSWFLARILTIDNLIAEISICFVAFVSVYLALVVLLYGTYTPLIEFIDIVKEMTPSLHKRAIVSEK
jgi:PST family polysaccharide transporter